jgi:hypothetical protein
MSQFKSAALMVMASLLTVSVSQAQSKQAPPPWAASGPEFAVVGGVRSNSGDTDLSGVTIGSSSGLQLGVLGFIPFNETFSLRTGFTYTGRNYTISSGGTTIDAKPYYFDIPATLMINFNDYGGIFAGPVIALNSSKECSASGAASCTLTNVKGTIMPIALGGSFKFGNQMGAEVFFEMLSGEIQTDIKNIRSVGANFVYYFE